MLYVFMYVCCVLYMYVLYAHDCVGIRTHADIQRDQRKEPWVILCSSLAYSLETGTLTEQNPTISARLADQ